MILEAFLLLIYKLLLDYVYLNYVSDLYQYHGFIANVNPVKFLEANIMILIIFTYFRINNKELNISNIILSILILSIIVPTCVLYGMEDSNRTYFYIILIGFLITIFFSRLPIIKVKQIVLANERQLIRTLITVSLIVIFLLIIFVGAPSINALNFNNVYEIRSSASLPRLLSYLTNWQTKVLTLFLIGYSLFNKKRLLLFTALGIQIIIYTITAHKIVLFAPVLLVGLYFILKYFKRFYLLYITLMNTGVIFTYFLYKFGISEWPATLFIRRMLFVPVKNSNYVFDFFFDIEKIRLSNSILKGIFIYPFDKGAYYLIGEKYYNNPMTNANANYLADSYLHFGLIGVLLFSILLGILLWALKTISFGKPIIITVGAILIGFYSIIDSALLTSMLTNGILLGMFLILIIKKSPESMNTMSEKVGGNYND